jgi:hypothetical protein
MSITDFSSLQSAIGDFLNRSDLTSVLPTFIQMCEADVNRRLRHWQMEVKDTITVDAQFEDLPTGWRETIRCDVQGGPRLKLVAHPEMQAMRAETEDTSGEPRFYAFVAGQMEFFPTPDGSYTINHVYFKEITALDESNTTNWLLTNYPDVYLYGSLAHTAPYLVEDARLPVWESLYEKAMQGAKSESDRARHSGTQRIKVR